MDFEGVQEFRLRISADRYSRRLSLKEINNKLWVFKEKDLAIKLENYADTNSLPKTELEMQDDGNLVFYVNSTAIWHSNTSFG